MKADLGYYSPPFLKTDSYLHNANVTRESEYKKVELQTVSFIYFFDKDGVGWNFAAEANCYCAPSDLHVGNAFLFVRKTDELMLCQYSE